MSKRKYIVWSFDPDNHGEAFDGADGQTMCDVVMATSPKHACQRVAKQRGECVTVDTAMPLDKYVKHLLKVQAEPPEQTEREFKEIF